MKKRAHVHCVSGGKKCSFLGKFGVLCFLVTLLPTNYPFNADANF